MEETNRQLATVQEILEVNPIEGADNIEVVSLKNLDWKCVAKKGEFKSGDKCVYFEIDSLVKGVKGLEFMESRNWRIRTIKLRGVLSQGLALPLSALEIDPSTPVDTNLTQQLGVKLYMSPQEARNKGAGGRFGQPESAFPTHLANKTDEVRCQGISGSMTKETHGDVVFYGREKLDGSSMTLVLEPPKPWPVLKWLGSVGSWLAETFNLKTDQELMVCSRNLRLRHPSKLKNVDQPGHFWSVVLANNVEKSVRDYVNSIGQTLTVQAEVVGPGTGSQGDYYDLKKHEMFVFDVQVNKKGAYTDQRDLDSLVGQIFGEHSPNVRVAPVIFKQKLPFNDHGLDTAKLLEMSDRKTQIPGLKAVNSEGIVWRPEVEMSPPGSKFENNRLSFKAISNTFLLKQKD